MAKIFIVEDNIQQLTTLESKARKLGHTVVGTAQRAMEALAKIKVTLPEIVLLDINLNGDNDGIALAHEIKAFAAINIIYVSSLNTTEIINQAVCSNPSGYMVKPIKLDDLKATINLALHQNNIGTIAQRITQTDSKTNYLTVRLGHKLKIIYFDAIKVLKIESRNHVTLIDEHNHEHVIRSSMKSVLELLNARFIQVHRLYAVNLNFFSHVDEKERTVYLWDNMYVPIGKVYKTKLYQKLNIL